MLLPRGRIPSPRKRAQRHLAAGTFRALTPTSSEYKTHVNPSSSLRLLSPLGPGFFSEIELNKNTQFLRKLPQIAVGRGEFTRVLHSPLCRRPPLVGGLMKRTVGAVREGDVLDYLRWVRGSGNLMPHLAGPIAKKGLWRGQGGLKRPLKKKGF